ncbi:IS607 family transposase, partial [Bifidobacterium sp. SO1]|nr:IS607 family transposase [Bifidobacterium sp. SO1]
RLFIEAQGRKIIVINEAADDRTDLIQDLVSIIYSFSARLYGQRRSKKAVKMVDILTQAESGVDDAVEA